MRKVVLIFTLLFLLSFDGCNNTSSNSDIEGSTAMQEINLTETEWCGINWDQIEFLVDLSEIEFIEETKSIETRKDAIEVATTLIEKCHEIGKFSSYTLLSITHSTKDNVWRFDYSIDQRNKDNENLVDCGCLYVAIDGNEGKLIKAWIEE